MVTESLSYSLKEVIIIITRTYLYPIEMSAFISHTIGQSQLRRGDAEMMIQGKFIWQRMSIQKCIESQRLLELMIEMNESFKIQK